MRAPGPWLAAPPPWAPPCVCRSGGRRRRGPGTPPGCDPLAVVRDPLHLFGVGGGVRRRRRLGHLPGVHAEQPQGLQAPLPGTLFHLHGAYDTWPGPRSWGLPAGPARFCEPPGEGLRLPPHRECLPYSASPGPQGQQTHVFCQTPPHGACALGDHAAPARPRARQASSATGVSVLALGGPARTPTRGGARRPRHCLHDSGARVCGHHGHLCAARREAVGLRAPGTPLPRRQTASWSW